MSEMVSQGKGGDVRVGVKVFFPVSWRQKVLVIKDEVRSLEGFGREAQEQRLEFGTWIRRGRVQGLKLKE